MAFRKNAARGAMVSLAAVAVAAAFAAPAAAQTFKTQDPPKPQIQGGETITNPSSIGYTNLRNWAARIERINYSSSGSGKGFVFIDVSFRNIGKAPRDIRSDELIAKLLSTVDAPFTEFHRELVSGKGLLAPGEAIRYTLQFKVGDEKFQSKIRTLQIFERTPIPLSKKYLDGPTVELAVPPMSESASKPVPATGSANLAAIKVLEGTYRTNAGTLLTLKVDGAHMIGTAVSTDVSRQTREQLDLTVNNDLAASGNWREEKGGKLVWNNVVLIFKKDGSAFSGSGSSSLSTSSDRFPYNGTRVPAGQPATGGASPGAAFKRVGPFELRMDAAGRRTPTGQYEIAMTARNYKGARMALQHFDIEYYAVGSSGIEYKWMKNFYGESGDDKLEHTVWMAKSEQAPVTFIFPSVPRGVMPTKLRVRDMMSNDLLGEFSLAGLPTERKQLPGDNAVPVETQTGTPPGTAVKLEHYDATLLQLTRDTYGNWEAEVSYTNNTSGEVTLRASDMDFGLFAADNTTRYAARSFFQARNSPRRGIPDTLRLAPGQTLYMRLWIPQSANFTPARYKFQEYGGTGKGGGLMATFLNKPN